MKAVAGGLEERRPYGFDNRGVSGGDVPQLG